MNHLKVVSSPIRSVKTLTIYYFCMCSTVNCLLLIRDFVLVILYDIPSVYFKPYSYFWRLYTSLRDMIISIVISSLLIHKYISLQTTQVIIPSSACISIMSQCGKHGVDKLVRRKEMMVINDYISVTFSVFNCDPNLQIMEFIVPW